jgi:predicted outer membrane repeat protein
MIAFDLNLRLRVWNESQPSPISIQSNHATGYGGFLEAYNSINTIEQFHFTNNSAQYGGVFFIWNTSLMLVGSGNHTVPLVFRGNMATVDGGVIYATKNSIITNMAYSHGGAVGAVYSMCIMKNCQFISNKAKNGFWWGHYVN